MNTKQVSLVVFRIIYEEITRGYFPKLELVQSLNTVLIAYHHTESIFIGNPTPPSSCPILS